MVEGLRILLMGLACACAYKIYADKVHANGGIPMAMDLRIGRVWELG